MNTKNVILGMAIAVVILVATIGSASAATKICPSCGGTIATSGTYILTCNLSCPDTHGLVIDADDVTLNGYDADNDTYHWIDGVNNGNCALDPVWTPPFVRCGIYTDGDDNVTMKNLEVKRFCVGIFIKGPAENCTIEKCQVHSNGNSTYEPFAWLKSTQGIMLYDQVDNSNITKNEIYNNTGKVGSPPCQSGAAGIYLEGTSCNNTITCNNVHDNNAAGIITRAMCGWNYVAYNNVSRNGEVGFTGSAGGIILRCKKAHHWLIEKNNVTDNYGPGIYIGGPHNNLRYNTVKNNHNRTTGDIPVGHGITIRRQDDWPDGGRNNTIEANAVCDNEGIDIHVFTAGYFNAGDENTCNSCNNYNDGGETCCTWTCNDLLSVYYDFDEDTFYSKDLEDCSCGIVGGSQCACCNPGLFNSSGVNMHCVGGVCSQTVGNDPNDCDDSVIPELTYTISGTTTPAADTVNITNLNNSKEWAASIDGNFYTLTLNVGEDVNATEILRIIACDTPDNYTSNCNRTDHVPQNIPGEDTVNLLLNHYCQNYYPTFPFHTWNDTNWSGPAAMEMLIDNYRDSSDVPNQTELNETGIGYNQGCNADIQYVDPRGMMYTLNKYLHAYNGLPYVANYGVGSSSTTIENVLHYMCKWHYKGPGAAPAYGNYSNWMVVRGIHTNKTPSFTQGSYEIKGFWLNDPKDPGGIGENTYKSVEQWKSTYHLKLNKSDVNMSDNYYDRYVAVCEPPEDDDVVVTLAKPKPRLAEAITPMLAEEPMMLYGVKQLALEKVVKDDELLEIVQAAIDGVNEELVPYDSEFASVFAKTVPGKPMLVTSDNGDYYVVPFNVPVEVRLPVKKMPVEIERPKISGLKKLERMKRVADKIELKPIPIEPLKVEKTLVVVLVDAEDGSFKEASWVKNPVKYLPVSKVEAVKLALGEVLDELHVVAKKDARDLEVIQQKPTIELVYRDASPYYPDWKVTVNGKVFYVGQDGTVSN